MILFGPCNTQNADASLDWAIYNKKSRCANEYKPAALMGKKCHTIRTVGTMMTHDLVVLRFELGYLCDLFNPFGLLTCIFEVI